MPGMMPNIAPMLGGFDAAMGTNRFSGSFPARLPAKPNPLAVATPQVHGLADVKGVQAAMAKRATLQRSSVGDIKRELKFNPGVGQTGQAAWDSLDAVMRKTGADAFSVAFFARLQQQGASPEQTQQCIKQAAAQCGDEVGAILTRDFEKCAAFGLPALKNVGQAIGRGLTAAKGSIGNAASRATSAVTGAAKALPGQAATAAKALPGQAATAAKALPGKAMGAARAVAPHAKNVGMLGLTGLSAAGGVAGLDAANSVSNMAEGLPTQLAETANAFRGDLSQHAADLRGQLAEATKPFAAIGDAIKPFTGMASGLSQFVKSNPWLLPMLLGGAGGGLLGGRAGATLGGIGAPLAYLAATGQLGQLGGLGEHFKSMLGQKSAPVDPAAGMAAATGGGGNRLNPPAAAAQPAMVTPQRSELSANQLLRIRPRVKLETPPAHCRAAFSFWELEHASIGRV